MPSTAVEESESRTSTVGSKRSPSSRSSRHRKRRKRNSAMNDQSPEDIVFERNRPSDADSSWEEATSTTMATRNATDSPRTAQTGYIRVDNDNYGKNRLTTGFAKPTTNDTHSGPRDTAAASSRHVAQVSGNMTIEISDDEEFSDSPGGIMLNVADQQSSHNAVAVSDDEDMDSGEISEDDDDISPSSDRQQEAGRGDDLQAADGLDDETSFIIDSHPITATKKLAELTPNEREEQIKYALYYLDRDQIDLSRPVVCLKCFSEGHLSMDCQQNTLFPSLNAKVNGSIRLWISCCICASKMHLVGDCPEADRAQSQRWSLAELDPSQVINLSLEAGTRKLEKEAENRGMRPANLSIKGRAGRHTAGFGPQQRRFSSDDDSLLPRKRGRDNNMQHDRRDDFGASEQPSKQQRGGWYATDSFGRRKSQSPDQHRPVNERRPPSPRSRFSQSDTLQSGGDTWRPPPTSLPAGPSKKDKPRGRFTTPRNQSPILDFDGKPLKRPPPKGAKRRIHIDLPTRNGSGGAATSNAGKSSGPKHPPQSKSKKSKKKGKG